MSPASFVQWGISVAFVGAVWALVAMVCGYFLRNLLTYWKEQS